MSKNTVCHLTSVHAYNDTRIFHKECVSLAKAGYDVTLIAPVSDGIQERGVTVLPAGRWNNRYYRLFVTIPRLLGKAIKVKASIYHFHDPELLLIVPFLKLSGSTVIYDIHEDYITSIQQKTYIPSPFRKLIATTLGIVEGVVAGMCRQVIAERYYKERFSDALEVLNYPVLPDRSVDTIKDLRPDQEVGFDDRYHWCLYTGNVTLDRGALLHLELLRAHNATAIAYIGKCSRDVADAIYRYAQKLNISRQRVRIIGIGEHVPRETIDYYTYSGSWLAGVALFPDTPHYTKKELTKFFEYMAAGLPILSSDFPAWKSIVEINSCGICVDPVDTQAITSAIEYLLANPDEAAALGKRGREAVYARYSWNVEESKLLGLYESISGKG